MHPKSLNDYIKKCTYNSKQSITNKKYMLKQYAKKLPKAITNRNREFQIKIPIETKLLDISYKCGWCEIAKNCNIKSKEFPDF